MKFNFPKKEEYILVNVKLFPDMFEKIREISEREECLRADTIKVLLEAAIEEYFKQGEPEPEKTAYPIAPSSEHSSDEKKNHPTLNEFGHKYVGWSFEHDSYVDCGRTDIPHAAKGLCSTCYKKEYRKVVSPQESGKKGGLKTKELHGQEHLQEISSSGGNATVKKYGKEYMRELSHKAVLKKAGISTTVEPLPKEWWKEENLPVNPRIPDRQPLPENFDGETAFCQYILCETKKYKRSEGIEIDGRTFCSEKHYTDWQEQSTRLQYN